MREKLRPLEAKQLKPVGEGCQSCGAATPDGRLGRMQRLLRSEEDGIVYVFARRRPGQTDDLARVVGDDGGPVPDLRRGDKIRPGDYYNQCSREFVRASPPHGRLGLDGTPRRG